MISKFAQVIAPLAIIVLAATIPATAKDNPKKIQSGDGSIVIERIDPADDGGAGDMKAADPNTAEKDMDAPKDQKSAKASKPADKDAEGAKDKTADKDQKSKKDDKHKTAKKDKKKKTNG